MVQDWLGSNVRGQFFLAHMYESTQRAVVDTSISAFALASALASHFKVLRQSLLSSPEHKVLMVSYCDQSISSTICFKS